jgi:hypothetical protein
VPQPVKSPPSPPPPGEIREKKLLKADKRKKFEGKGRYADRPSRFETLQEAPCPPPGLVLAGKDGTGLLSLKRGALGPVPAARFVNPVLAACCSDL